MNKIPIVYYLIDDVVALSRDLIGKMLMTNIDGRLTGGMIVETEAYRAPEDKASHAYGYRRTPRNAAMYKKGGVAYVFQCYGIHSLFNIVTNGEGHPHAVLIRAIQPLVGIDHMLDRRGLKRVDRRIAGGPGCLTQALGILQEHNYTSLASNSIWLEHAREPLSSENIVASPRVGIDYAGEDAQLPWRFRLKGSRWTSPAK